MSASGDSRISTANCATVKAALPETPPDDAVTLATPSPTAVTSPFVSTVATASSADDHVTSVAAAAWPLASVASAMNRTVSPIALRVSAAGDTATSDTRCSTVTIALADCSPEDAVTLAVPFPTAVTRPESSTVTTASSADDHVASAPATAWPFESLASAVNRAVSASARRVSAAGDTATSATTCSTATSAPPLAVPAVAVTRMLPCDTAVTSPAALTVATAASLLAQLTATPDIAWPFWSCTVAASCAVAPSARSLASGGETTTSVGTGGGGATGSSSPPHPVNHRAVAVRARKRALEAAWLLEGAWGRGLGRSDVIESLRNSDRRRGNPILRGASDCIITSPVKKVTM